MRVTPVPARAARLAMITLSIVALAACEELRTSTEPLPIGASLLIAPATDTLFIGDTLQADDSVRFVAAVRTFSGDTVEFTGVRWESSNPLVATVDSTGLVIARGVGEATISAQAGEERASAVVVVEPATATLVLLPALDTLLLGDSLQLFAQAYDANGAPVTGVRYDFATDADTVATVDSVGLVRAIAVGDARITVSASGRQATSDIAVIDTAPPAPPPPPFFP